MIEKLHPEDLNENFYYKLNAIVECAISKKWNVVLKLIEKMNKEDINNINGAKVLLLACKYCLEYIAIKLIKIIDKEYIIDIKDNFNKGVLDYVESNKLEQIKLFIS